MKQSLRSRRGGRGVCGNKYWTTFKKQKDKNKTGPAYICLNKVALYNPAQRHACEASGRDRGSITGFNMKDWLLENTKEEQGIDSSLKLVMRE